MKVDALQADSGQLEQPDTIAEIRVRQRRAGRAGEDERRPCGQPVQVYWPFREAEPEARV